MDRGKPISVLQVGGKWDDEGGKASGYARKLFDELNFLWKVPGHPLASFCATPVTCNGGKWDELVSLMDLVEHQDIIIWMADCPNDKPKLVDQIKVKNPKCILVISKNNIDNKYTPLHLIARMLKVKSNLMLEFGKTENVYCARVLDPLGNSFGLPFLLKKPHFYTDIKVIADILYSRLYFLNSMRRVASTQLAGEVPIVPDESEFFALAREQAEVFHDLIHADNTRFMGNLSFRCESGFPSFRVDDKIYVSKRNIDKREIDKNGFVPVLAGSGGVFYFGEHKPSVDTPVQLEIYNHFPNINYMIHSHVYVEDATGFNQMPVHFTGKVLPCGAIQEAQEIEMLFHNGFDGTKFAVNLRGHGSIVAGQTVKDLRGYRFIAREIPEMHTL